MGQGCCSDCLLLIIKILQYLEGTVPGTVPVQGHLLHQPHHWIQEEVSRCFSRTIPPSKLSFRPCECSFYILNTKFSPMTSKGDSAGLKNCWTNGMCSWAMHTTFIGNMFSSGCHVNSFISQKTCNFFRETPLHHGRPFNSNNVFSIVIFTEWCPTLHYNKICDIFSHQTEVKPLPLSPPHICQPWSSTEMLKKKLCADPVSQTRRSSNYVEFV